MEQELKKNFRGDGYDDYRIQKAEEKRVRRQERNQSLQYIAMVMKGSTKR